MTPQITNSEKIILVLKEINTEASNMDLSEYTRIKEKNIGKILKDLEKMNLISRQTEQQGKKRYTMNKITSKGKHTHIKITYKTLMKELEQDDMEKAIVINQLNGNAINPNTRMESDLRYNIPNEKPLVSETNNDTKTELLGIIKVIAIRTQDAHRLKFKTHQELTKHIISLILKL